MVNSIYQNHSIGEHWTSWMVVGALVALLGLFCLGAPVAATLTSAWLLGVSLVVAGIVQIVAGFRERTWAGRFLYVGLGILEVVVGWLMAASPAATAVGLTLLIAAYLLVAGLMRVAMAFGLRFEGWGWQVGGGVITAFLGLLVFAQWPYSGLWFNGVAIGISLLTQGIATMALALAARRHRTAALR
jgi:uncharacterized membrane protein HdeD (DUF308 family)